MQHPIDSMGRPLAAMLVIIAVTAIAVDLSWKALKKRYRRR